MGKPTKIAQHSPADRLLIVMPTALDHAVLAVPTLRAFRQLYPKAHITALLRRHLRPVLDGCPWIDRVVSIRKKSTHAPTQAKSTGPIKLAARLASGKFDTAVLLPDSFRSALLVRLAGIPRRVGYDREKRSSMLTDRLLSRRVHGRYIPVPTRELYLGLARYLGAVNTDSSLQLFTRPEDDRRADELLAGLGIHLEAADARPRRPLILLHAGALHNDSKNWLPQRFAEVADQCTAKLDAVVAIVGETGEQQMVEKIKRHARQPVVDLHALGVDLALLKSITRRASLLIGVDAGPRAVAAAFGLPLVTVFGPTDPIWAEAGVTHERQIFADLPCRPGQKEKRSRDGNGSAHSGWEPLSAETLFKHAAELLRHAASLRNLPASPSALHHSEPA